MKVGNFKLDGFYKTEMDETVVLEYKGCFWHGCVKC